MVLVGAEGSPVNNGIGTSVQARVYAACVGEISHILFWSLGSKECVCACMRVCVCECSFCA